MAAAGILATGCTEAEARARAALVDVESYAVFLDLAADPGTVRSRAEIRFRCPEPGAATFADLRAVTIAATDGPWTAAGSATRSAWPCSSSGPSCSRYSRPAQGRRHSMRSWLTGDGICHESTTIINIGEP